jgi:hypothetical protein
MERMFSQLMKIGYARGVSILAAVIINFLQANTPPEKLKNQLQEEALQVKNRSAIW